MNILFVDDEPQILRSLHRLFMETDYGVFLADSGKAALEILADEKIDLLMTDMRMPGMDGIQLLERIKEAYPDVLRIILSGYSERETILTALQKNLAKLYIMKPWNNAVLLDVVRQIFATENILSDHKLLQFINNMAELPALKSSYNEIVCLMDQSADIAQIAAAIEKDPAIATQILHIINSAFYEIKTGNIEQAITLLGLSTTKNIVLATSLVDACTAQGTYSVQLEIVWKHSYICSRILNIIYEKFFNKKLSEINSAAGILHNIGMAILFAFSPEKYRVIFNQLSPQNGLLRLETASLPVTHQQVGAYLLKWWEIPYPIVEAALYHHTPFTAGIVHKELVYGVHLAQYYANVFMKHPWGKLDDRVFTELGLKQAEVESVIFNLLNQGK